MKKNILAQVGTEIIENQMPILDDDGNPTGEFETVRREIPIMESQYVEMTAEEIAEMETEPIQTEPTLEERVAQLETELATLKAYVNSIGKTELVGEGTADNPFNLTVGMDLVPNAYYSYNGTRYVYMGNASTYDGGELTFDNGWAEF